MSDNIKEGEATIKNCSGVFYNPAQKFNRDLTILVINNYLKNKQDVKIFEAMSATGLRGIRFAKELEGECKIYLNDIDEDALHSIRANLIDNNITKIEENVFVYNDKKIYLSNDNCNLALHKNANNFDVIDIDPFGCCTSFIDAALSNIKHDGLLCLTSTDTGVLCNNIQKCYIKYNAMIMKTPAHHEQSLRILLGYICKAAGKFNKHIEPILCVSVDFYIRLFVKLRKGHFKKSYEDVSYYLYCCNCFYTKEVNRDRKIQTNSCDHCKQTLKICGPLYNKKIKDSNFIDTMIERANNNRISGVLLLIKDEIDTFLFYVIPDLCHYLRCDCIPLVKFITAILNLGYKASLTHCELNSVKTNAPITILYAIIKEYFCKNDDYKFDIQNIFTENLEAIQMTKKNYYRKMKDSKLGPMSRPKK
ncbi:tRNA methyltransferase 1 [Binucleata daphniae]